MEASKQAWKSKVSYTTLYKVPESGEIELAGEFHNSHRGAMLVWMLMSEAYLHRPFSLSNDVQSAKPTWNLWKNPDVRLSDRIVMASTFDKIMVKRENIPRLVQAIEDYSRRFDPGTLLKQACILKELASDETCFAVCWNQTSVCADAWYVPGETDDEEWRPFDLSRDHDYGHWFLFEDHRLKEDKSEKHQSSVYPVSSLATDRLP